MLAVPRFNYFLLPCKEDVIASRACWQNFLISWPRTAGQRKLRHGEIEQFPRQPAGVNTELFAHSISGSEANSTAWDLLIPGLRCRPHSFLINTLSDKIKVQMISPPKCLILVSITLSLEIIWNIRFSISATCFKMGRYWYRFRNIGISISFFFWHRHINIGNKTRIRLIHKRWLRGCP